MSNIEEVKKLRKLSGAGFKDCLSALNEAKGNLDKAINLLDNTYKKDFKNSIRL